LRLSATAVTIRERTFPDLPDRRKIQTYQGLDLVQGSLRGALFACLLQTYNRIVWRHPSHARSTYAPPAAGSRGDPYYAGGRGQFRQAGDALFDRQGFLGAPAPCHEGVLSGKAAVSISACGYDLEVPRDARISRADGGRARFRPPGPHQRRWGA